MLIFSYIAALYDAVAAYDIFRHAAYAILDLPPTDFPRQPLF